MRRVLNFLRRFWYLLVIVVLVILSVIFITKSQKNRHRAETSEAQIIADSLSYTNTLSQVAKERDSLYLELISARDTIAADKAAIESLVETDAQQRELIEEQRVAIEKLKAARGKSTKKATPKKSTAKPQRVVEAPWAGHHL